MSLSEQEQQQSTPSLLRQTLMSQDECFVYKVPPLATASGYRANDWNLASPLQTCGFQVERRDNDLYLLFTLENHTKLFALSKIDANSLHRSIEPVLDSSRYFVTKITNTQKPNQSTTLGFGFRDRDVAIDLLGNLQQFQKSIEREIQASKMKVTAIPTLKEGDKMHIHLPIKHAAGDSQQQTHAHKKRTTTAAVATTGSGPLLLKKPPPGATAESMSSPSTTTSKQRPQQQRNIDEDEEDHIVNLNDVKVALQAVEQAEDEALATGDTNSEAAVAKSVVDTLDENFDDDDDDDNDDGLDEKNDMDDDFGDFQEAS
jgi:hypothetical protein